MRAFLITGVLVAFLGPPVCSANGAAVQNTYQLIGTGSLSCGQFVEYQNQNNKAQVSTIVQWVWGYLSAYNSQAPRTKGINLPDEATVPLFVGEFCKRNPLSNVVTAAEAMIRKLGGTTSLDPSIR
jgi:hypothetical protein